VGTKNVPTLRQLLAAALEAQGLKRGIASFCIGGGEATAVAIERL
jgi:acetyl-CoA C-acetyltransferase